MVLNGTFSNGCRKARPDQSEPDTVAGTGPAPVIGLVGGIGSGKSTVARHLTTRRSVAVLDADEIGHRVLTEPQIQQKIRERFGEAVFDEQQNVDRAELGRRVFGDSAEKRQARFDLEQIVHPRIRAELQQEIERLRDAGGIEAILLDAAVLLEAGWNQLADRIVFVDCSPEQRLARVAAGRNWDLTELRKRETSQYSLDRKRAAADATIDNSGDPATAAGQLESILDQVMTTYPSLKE